MVNNGVPMVVFDILIQATFMTSCIIYVLILTNNYHYYCMEIQKLCSYDLISAKYDM